MKIIKGLIKQFCTPYKALPSHKDVQLIVFPVVFGCVFFLFLANTFLSGKQIRFDELALGANSVSYFATINGYKIHCTGIKGGEECIHGWEIRGRKPIVLWLGNSQLDAINQKKPGDENAPPMLFRSLSPYDIDVLAFSQPNVNLQEHYVLFEYLINRLSIQILILPIVLDDTREDGLRQDFTAALDDSQVELALRKSLIGQSLLKYGSANSASGDLAGLNGSNQLSVEGYINNWLEKNSAIWASRSGLRGQLLNFLYQLRNAVFGITPQSKRRIIPGRYENNINAFRALLSSSAEKGIHVLVYIVPIRNDVETPYVETEYLQFKQDVKRVAWQEGAVFANLDELVPAQYWGEKNSTSVNRGAELDFMHFQAGGHRLLAERIYKLLETRNLIDVFK